MTLIEAAVPSWTRMSLDLCPSTPRASKEEMEQEMRTKQSNFLRQLATLMETGELGAFAYLRILLVVHDLDVRLEAQAFGVSSEECAS